MTKIRDPHLRCEICDFCESAGSVFHSGLVKRSNDLPASATVAIRDGRAICNACEVSHFDTADNDLLLTEAPKDVSILYKVGDVTTYPATHPKLTYYNLKGITEEDKDKWRTEYVASLMEGCVPFRGGKR